MMNASASFADPPHTAAAVRTVRPASIAMVTATISASGVAPPLPEADAPTVQRECTKSSTASLFLKSKRSRRPHGQVTV